MRRLHLLLGLLALPVASANASELRGSRASIRGQHEYAAEHDFTFLRTPAQVKEFVEEDRLEEVASSAHLEVADVSFPFTRPAVKLFIERLAEQYFRATGDKLVVTSLTRPTSAQPRNASPWSVHPAGIAVDLRIPALASQRAWLEETLLALEQRDVLDVTRERRPPHYHVAVFPEPYQAYVAPLIEREVAEAATRVLEAAATATQAMAALPVTAPRGLPALGIAALVAGALLVGATGTLTVRHARR